MLSRQWDACIYLLMALNALIFGKAEIRTDNAVERVIFRVIASKQHLSVSANAKSSDSMDVVNKGSRSAYSVRRPHLINLCALCNKPLSLGLDFSRAAD